MSSQANSSTITLAELDNILPTDSSRFHLDCLPTGSVRGYDRKNGDTKFFTRPTLRDVREWMESQERKSC